MKPTSLLRGGNDAAASFLKLSKQVFGFVGAGGDDPGGVRVSAHDDGSAFKGRVIPLLHGDEKGVQVAQKNVVLKRASLKVPLRAPPFCSIFFYNFDKR